MHNHFSYRRTGDDVWDYLELGRTNATLISGREAHREKKKKSPKDYSITKNRVLMIYSCWRRAEPPLEALV